MSATRTLLFCTAYSADEAGWSRRYATWLRAIRRGGLEYDQILLIDDCSPVGPAWPGLTIVPADGSTVSDQPLVLARFENHLGRRRFDDSPGWFRSFTYAAQYGRGG